MRCKSPIAYELRRQRQYCSDLCKRLAQQARNAARGLDPLAGNERIGASNVGAAHELVVCVDLLRHGWTVFRNVSPVGCADLVAVRDGKIIMVEVTTARRTAGGSLSFSPRSTRHRYDVLALVTHLGGIEYRPAGLVDGDAVSG